MSNGNGIHVVPREGNWKVKQEGAQRSSGNFDTQAEAIARARELAIKQQKELLIHGVDGKIRQKNSYGNDPFPPKG